MQIKTKSNRTGVNREPNFGNQSKTDTVAIFISDALAANS